MNFRHLFGARNIVLLALVLLSSVTCGGDSKRDQLCQTGKVQRCETQKGECQGATQSCVNGKWGDCSKLPSDQDECDGKDNDCDGVVDSGCPCSATEPDRSCGSSLGECKAGTQKCVNGQWGECSGASEPEDRQEICDGKDNNCDGHTDEGCPCTTGARQPCGDDDGECTAGTQACVDGNWGDCQGDSQPDEKTERCDGKDNDCDGDTDEDCPCTADARQSCGDDDGECAAGTQTCVDGNWGDCNGDEQPDDMRERCDGLDNNCDGATDEGCPCTEGARQSCGDDDGECTAGTQTCVDGNWGDCENDSEPVDKTEWCDGKDNDCDGDVDEGCDCLPGTRQECGTTLGACEPGVQYCIAGRWGSCESASDDLKYVGQTQEECDREDNDCDGDIDEGCSCIDGSTLDCGSAVGQCEQGIQTCDGGRWGSCELATGPDSEVCDGKDNDCDGDVDEGCDCEDGTVQTCGTTLGACEPGVQHCASGRWGGCQDVSVIQPHVTPQQEECDGEDNDCDGDVDEGCECEDGDEQDCGDSLGACEPGVQRCDDGRWGNCADDVGPEPEACDGEDNDCDADIDEGCDCLDGSVRACGSSLGACETGLQHCQNGRWGACLDDVGPESETCDAVDNDCDGDIDEGCNCQNSATRWCDGGAGACRSGLQTCDAGSWGECVPVTSPSEELCDGIDNDCDGEVDNGFDLDVPCPVGGCPQRRICSPNQLASSCVEDARLRTPERCDGVDNDCNKLVDHVSENGSIRSICECESRTLSIGRAVNASVAGNVNLCAPTQCGGDKPRGLLLDGICWPACQSNSDPDGDGWGFENGSSCVVEDSARGQTAPPCGGVPLGMAMTYCLKCTAPLPYAMCQSLPRHDLRAFGRGEKWLKIDYTYTSIEHARVPINFYFHVGDGTRKRLPLVRIGDVPGRHRALLRVEDACFTPSAAFGSACAGHGDHCDHCGPDEVCGAIAECGDYDLTQTWLQIAAEFCEEGIGNQAGTLTIHSIDTVEPNCGE